MEFAWNTQKNKMSDVKGKEMEQERKGRVSNQDIDLEKTYLNFDFVESNKTLYQRIKDRVDEVRPISRIQKNSVVDFSNIITVPKAQYEKWGIEKSKDYLREVYNYFCEEFGKENVVSAKVHLDETTPHMHLHFVPVNQENGKLQARSVMTPGRINAIHTTATMYLQEKGFEVERGKGKTEKSLDIHSFKAEKLKEDINTLEYKLKALESDLSVFKDVQGNLGIVDGLNAKKSLLGAKISIKEEDYEMLIGLAKKSFVLSAKVESLEEQNNILEDRLNEYKTRVSDRVRLTQLEKENSSLKIENLELKRKYCKTKTYSNIDYIRLAREKLWEDWKEKHNVFLDENRSILKNKEYEYKKEKDCEMEL